MFIPVPVVSNVSLVSPESNMEYCDTFATGTQIRCRFAFLVISGIASFRTLSIRRKLMAGIELVLKNKGRSVREIVKAGKLVGIPGSAVRKATVKLANQGKISFDRDLDNNLFVKKQ